MMIKDGFWVKEESVESSWTKGDGFCEDIIETRRESFKMVNVIGECIEGDIMMECGGNKGLHRWSKREN